LSRSPRKILEKKAEMKREGQTGTKWRRRWTIWTRWLLRNIDKVTRSRGGGHLADEDQGHGSQEIRNFEIDLA
jgi:hypothetical protein